MQSTGIPLISVSGFHRGPIYQTANKQTVQMLKVDTHIRNEVTCTYQ